MMEAQIYYRRMLAGERQSLGLNRDFGAKESAEPTLRSGREEHNNLLAAGRCGKADYIRIYSVHWANRPGQAREKRTSFLIRRKAGDTLDPCVVRDGHSRSTWRPHPLTRSISMVILSAVGTLPGLVWGDLDGAESFLAGRLSGTAEHAGHVPVEIGSGLGEEGGRAGPSGTRFACRWYAGSKGYR